MKQELSSEGKKHRLMSLLVGSLIEFVGIGMIIASVLLGSETGTDANGNPKSEINMALLFAGVAVSVLGTGVMVAGMIKAQGMKVTQSPEQSNQNLRPPRPM